jgi:hypothetical protein
MYLNQQIPDQRDIVIAPSMSEAIYLLEERAAERHGRIAPDVHEADLVRLSHVPQRWGKTAKFKAKASILRGTSKYEGFLWESFCRAYGTKEDKSSAS